MDKGKGPGGYCQRKTGKRQNNASNNKEGCYQSSLEKCVDSGHVSLSRHGTFTSLSSDTLDILELGPNSQLDDATLTSQSGLETAKQLPRKFVADSSASFAHHGWKVYKPYVLPSPPLGASMQQALPFREPHGYRVHAAMLTNCSKTFDSSGRTLKFPKQKQRRSHTQSTVSPSRYPSSAASTSKSVPSSSKSRSSPKSSQKSNFQKNFIYSITQPYLIPKSHQKYFKGNINRATTFNQASNTRWDTKDRHAFLDTSSDIDNSQLLTTPSQPSLSHSNNLSYNSPKTSKCTVFGPSLFQVSRFSSSGVGVRSKQPLVQGSQNHKRTGSESKRNSQKTTARRRMLSLERHPTKPSLSVSNTYKILSTQRSQKENKEAKAAGYNILNSKYRIAAPQTAKYLSSKVTTKAPQVLKSRQTRPNLYNNRFGHKRATSMLARPKSAPGSERDSRREKASALSVSPKKAKLSRTPPKACPCKCGPHQAKKASRASFMWGAARSKLGAASRTRPQEASNCLKVYESLHDQQGTQNVKKTSFLFKFRARRWMLEPSTGCVVQCRAEGTSDRDSQDCFAAWELTQHEVLQSCRSEDLMIMNNAVSRSSPHSNITKSSSNRRLRKSKTPQSDAPLDKPKAASIRQETRVYTIAGIHPLPSLSGRSGHSLTNREKRSHSEYTSSADISSETSRWSLSSSLYSNISPSKSQKPYAGSSGLVKSNAKSRNGISSLLNHAKPLKHPNYRSRSNGESEHRKQGSLKYRQCNQCRKTPGIKTLQNRVILHREQPCQRKTSLLSSNARRNTNKQGQLDLPENPARKPQGFLINSNDEMGLQEDSSVESVKSPPSWHSETVAGKPNIPSGILSSTAVPLGITAMEPAASVGSSSIYSNKQTPQPSICPGNRPNEVTGSIVSRFVRKENRKRISDAKKCVLITSQKTTFCVWKWRLLKLTIVLLIAISHYLAFVITTATL